MRSLTFLRLAFGLLAAGCAIASPCKPSSVATTSEGSSTFCTGTSSQTSIASSTTDQSATTPVLSESASGTYPSSSVELSASVTSQISETTAGLSTIETTSAEPTIIESTTTAAASTTETIPVPSFSLFATGQGPVEEDGLHTYDSDSSVAVFDPSPIFGDASVRPYTIDSQGRLVNDQGFFLCGFHIATNVNLDSLPSVGTCTSSGPKRLF